MDSPHLQAGRVASRRVRAAGERPVEAGGLPTKLDSAYLKLLVTRGKGVGGGLSKVLNWLDDIEDAEAPQDEVC